MSRGDSNGTPGEDTRISVIVPVLNEADILGDCLEQFRGQKNVEVLVVDGGSTDGTDQVVEPGGFAQWIVSPQVGRAVQMNCGGAIATGDVLCFLHADTYLPEGGVQMMVDSLNDPTIVGGRFRLGLSESTPIFRLIAWLSTIRSRYLGITYGDQGIYVRRSVFEAVGGYPERDLFEDSEFCSAVSKLGRFVMLEDRVLSSPRRWRKWGVLRTVIWMWALRILYACSVSDLRLSRWYRQVR